MDDTNRDEYGVPPGTDPREWLQRLTGRYLGDVRIHDSGQAGELARRLGAHAFTVGRDIYVRPELVRPVTRRGAALLAHELTHVVEQTGGTIEAGTGLQMPLLAPPNAPAQAPASPYQAAPAGEIGGQGHQGRGPSQGGAQQAVSVQRATSPSEQRAEATEAAALTRQRQAAPGKRRGLNVDPEILAELVYDLMRLEMITDRERGL